MPVLDHLYRLATLLEHLNDPKTSYQGQFGTCAATMAQVEMVTNHSAAYASMAADLVGTEGVGRLPSGDFGHRVPDSLVRANGDAGGQVRPRLSMVIQTALMELNSSSAGIYSNVDDRHWRDDGWGKVSNAVYSTNSASGTRGSDRVQTLTDMTGHAYTAIGSNKNTALAKSTIQGELRARRQGGGLLTIHVDAERQQRYVATRRNRPGLTRIDEDGTEALDRKNLLTKVHHVDAVRRFLAKTSGAGPPGDRPQLLPTLLLDVTRRGVDQLQRPLQGLRRR